MGGPGTAGLMAASGETFGPEVAVDAISLQTVVDSNYLVRPDDSWAQKPLTVAGIAAGVHQLRGMRHAPNSNVFQAKANT